MEFRKWPSICNSYRTKEIARWTERYPELLTMKYAITEKLHGSNIQVAFSPEGEVCYGSRNQWLDATDTFFGCFPRDIDDLIPLSDWESLSGLMLERAANRGQPIRMYGELFGPGIQKGVRYGDTKIIRWFGCRIGEELQPHWMLQNLVYFMTIVPLVEVVSGLQAALDFSSEFPSRINPEPDNLCEGIVIVPSIPTRSQDSWFMLKKKNEEFAERAHAKKEHVPDEVADPLNAAFRTYITDARMQSVFSKDGVIDDRKDIGRYIKSILADAKEDFIKDYPEVIGLDKSQQKAVYNVGATIAKMLMAEM